MKGLFKFLGAVFVIAMAAYGIFCFVKKYGKNFGIDLGTDKLDDDFIYEDEAADNSDCLCAKIRKGLQKEISKIS